MLNSTTLFSGLGVAPATNSYFSIATTTVGVGGVSSIVFNSIPQTYKHLQIRATVGAAGEIQGFFNGDSTATNYYRHTVYGQGSSAAATAAQSYGIYPAYLPTAGAFVQDILDYANTNKNKTTRSLWGTDNNGSGYVGLYSAVWFNTDAVNTISFSPVGGGNFPQYTQFALYGVN